MNELNNADVIRRNREVVNNQTLLFLEIIRDFLLEKDKEALLKKDK